MSLELVPKDELPEWSEKDEAKKRAFLERLDNGTLELLSAKRPKEFKRG